MAKNISPLMAHESEVHGLMAWSVAPTRILFYLSLVIAIQQFVFGIISLLLRKNILMGSWQLALSVAFIFMAWQVALFSKQSKNYVASEKGNLLDKALIHLGGFWTTYQMALWFSVAPLLLFLVRSFFGLDYQEISFKNYLALPAVIVTLVLILALIKDMRIPCTEKTLSQSAEAFARRNLNRSRTLTFFSIGIGLLWIWAYMGDALINTSLDKIAVAISGAAYLLIGASVGFVWRATREIQRNPSPIYFERTMEKINFFWLCACVGFVIILIGNFC